jgi:hypothetical protein
MALRNLALCGWFGGVILLTLIAWSVLPSSMIWLFGLNLFGVFPLYGLAVVLLGGRAGGNKNKANFWQKIGFRGLPPGFYYCFRIYFILVWLLSAYPLIRQMLRLSSWPSFGLTPGIGFILVPTAFHLIAAGIFWSVALEAKNSTTSHPPPLPSVSP